jgi:hypothetical protein|tara:strand:+ start:9193 stop:11394 length:2202 start_codon:yes stop_codon:yes gene_type:complete
MDDLKATNQVSTSDIIDENPTAQLVLTEGTSEEQLSSLSPLVQEIRGKFETAKNGKRSVQDRAVQAYSNYRGVKDDSTSFTETEISKAFIKITKTKTLAAYSQVSEVIFAEGKLPIEVVATPEPLGIPEYVHIDPNDPAAQEEEVEQEEGSPDEPVLGFPGDGKDLKPGETVKGRVMAWARSRFGDSVKTKMGAGDAPDRIVLSPAQRAASVMNIRIQDQLIEMYAGLTVRQSLLELVMLGTGIIKGPFNNLREYPSWAKDGTYAPYTAEAPTYKHTSFWDIYPDPEARKQTELGWVIERHKLNKSQLRQLKTNESFLGDQINKAIEQGPDYVQDDFERVLDESDNTHMSERYEVLEYWGSIDEDQISSMGIDLGFDWPDDVDELPMNVWVCNGEIIRLVVNPFTPARLPYLFANYELNPYSVFGVGLPENMEDTQMLMNGFMRLAVDNAVLSGTVMLEVDESVMTPGQQYVVEAGKIWKKNQQTQQAAIRPVQINNTSQANMQMFESARRLADESTGIPSFSHGMTGVQGVGRTASGIRDLLGAASLSTKTVVKGLDDFWFVPMGQQLYNWNMRYKFTEDLIGDVSIVAKGASNLSQKAEMLQNLMSAAQVVNPIPEARAWVNWKEYTKEVFRALELPEERMLNRPDEHAVQVKLAQMENGTAPAEAQLPQGPQVGGAPPGPGEPGFTGTPQEQGGIPQNEGQGVEQQSAQPTAGAGQGGGQGQPAAPGPVF